MTQAEKKSSNFLSSILDTQIEMIVVLKPDGEIHYVNKTLCEVFGVNSESLIGKRLNEILSPEQAMERMDGLKLINSKNRFIEEIREIQHQDGNVLYQEWRTTGLFDEKDKLQLIQSVGKDVTKRVIEEKSIRETKENLSLALQHANMGEFHTFTKTNDFYFSDDLLNVFGLSKQEFGNNFESYLNCIPSSKRSSIKELILAYIKNPSSEVFEYEHEIIRKTDGEIRWLLVRSRLDYDKEKGSKRFSGIAIDVTEKKEEELKLKRKQDNLSFALESAKIGDFEWLIEPNEVSFSSQIYELLGVEESKFEKTFEGFLSMIPKHGQEEFKHTVLNYLDKKSKELLVFENEIIKPNGNVIWVQNRCRINYDEQQNPVSFSGVILDFTAKKKEELKLIDREKKLALAMQFGKLSDFTWIIKDDILIWSDAIFDMHETSKEEFEPSFQNYMSFLPPDKVEWFKEKANSFIEDSDPSKIYEIEHEVILRNGKRKWFLIRSGLELDDNGQPYSFPGVQIDITDIVLARKKLAQSQERLKLATNVTCLGSFEWEISKDDFDWDDTMHQLFELNPTSREKRKDYYKKLMHPGDKLRMDSFFDQSLKSDNDSNVFESEHRILLPSGKVKYLSNHSLYFRNEQGEVVKILGTYLDVTKQKNIEKELKQALTELNKLKSRLEEENLYLQEEISYAYNFENLVYSSNVFSEVLNEVERVAPTDATVLVTGETGTGKELIARAIHNTSLRKDKPLIKVNCAAIPRELIESELFGHEKGSFTGATKDKKGKFELADGGTIFLDELGELPIDLQPKLLRALQEGEIERVGSEKHKIVDVRVIAATNRNLSLEVKEGRFRSDLYFRLNVFPIKIPPLRERSEDVTVLVDFFIKKYAPKYNKTIHYISDSALKNMMIYDWPGNVRELANSIERAVIKSNSDVLELPEFSGVVADKKKNLDHIYSKTLDEVQKEYILKVLKKCKGVIAGKNGAAQLLGLNPSTLRDRMKKLGISTK